MMKSLQALVVMSILMAAAPMAHASMTTALSSGALSSDAYAQDTTQDSTSHPADAAGDPQTSDTGHAHNDGSTSSHLPVGGGKAADSTPAESVRTPSWQSLLPGSIQ